MNRMKPVNVIDLTKDWDDGGLKQKADVNYRLAPEGGAQTCGSCIYFRADLQACSLVAGNIQSRDVCDLYHAKIPMEKAGDYRQMGESFKDCVSRKIAVNMKEGMERDQAVAAAHQMCKSCPEGELQKGYDPNKPLETATLGEYSEALHSTPERVRIFRSSLINYFEKPYHEIQKITETFAPYRAHLLRYAMIKLFPLEKADRVVNFESYGEEELLPAEYVAFTTGTEVLKGLLTGSIFFESDQLGKFVLKICPGWHGVAHVDIYSNDLDKACNVLTTINNFIRDNNFLKGKKLYHDGRFMKTPETKWEDVILSDEVKKKLEVHIIDYMNNLDERVAKGLPSKRGVLLIGPPGNGKTMIGKALANMIKETFIWVPYSDADLGDVFMMARELAPTMVFIEDMATQGGMDRRLRNNGSIGQLLNMMDGVEDNSKIFTLATENHVGLLDEALGDRPGRFDIIISMPNPAEEQRIKILRHYLPDQSDENIKLLAEDTENFSGSHLRELANRIILEKLTSENWDPVIDEIGNAFKELSEADLAGMHQGRKKDRRGKKKKKYRMMKALLDFLGDDDEEEKE